MDEASSKQDATTKTGVKAALASSAITAVRPREDDTADNAGKKRLKITDDTRTSTLLLHDQVLRNVYTFLTLKEAYVMRRSHVSPDSPE